MDDSVKGFVLKMPHKNGGAVSVCLIFLLAVFPLFVVDMAQGQTSQGGTLVFAGSGRFAPTDSVYMEQVVLQDYVGEPLKALQLRVISQGGVRLRSVERGADLTSAFEWNVSHVIARGQNGVDTAKVVIFGMGYRALPPRPYTELLTVKYEVVSPGGATLVFSDVLGALSRGEDAQVVAGPSRAVSVSTRK